MKKTLAFAVAALVAAGAYAQTAPFGTFTKPFAADSPWNIRPVGPVLGTYAPPLSNVGYLPVIGGGQFSTAAFLASETDQPMVIYPSQDKTGVWDPDARVSLPTVTIPRWPAATVPASGGDGHADIVDPVSGKVHSFWQLKFVDGKWRAAQHSWSLLAGKGWGDPSHTYQGARATGVPTMGGLIRKHEVDDGEPMYNHVLAMSMALEGLKGSPAYVYPATSADNNSAYTHKGQVPEGALMMLPANFTMQISDARLQKVVETLKVYGARVVDENHGTPYYIYVENGAGFSLYNGSGHDNLVNQELQRIRAALRQVVSAYSYVDGNGNPTTTNEPGNDNILSMRGPWLTYPKNETGAPFNSLTQSIEFPASPAVVEQQNGNGTGISGGSVANGGVTWSRPVPGATYRVTAIGSGGAQMRVQLYSGSSSITTPYLANGQSALITWPVSGGWASIWARSAANQAGSIRATMVRQ